MSDHKSEHKEEHKAMKQAIETFVSSAFKYAGTFKEFDAEVKSFAKEGVEMLKEVCRPTVDFIEGVALLTDGLTKVTVFFVGRVRLVREYLPLATASVRAVHDAAGVVSWSDYEKLFDEAVSAVTGDDLHVYVGAGKAWVVAKSARDAASVHAENCSPPYISHRDWSQVTDESELSFIEGGVVVTKSCAAWALGGRRLLGVD